MTTLLDVRKAAFEQVEFEFWSRVHVTRFFDPSACWEWIGRRMGGRNGRFQYGLFTPVRGMKSVLAHRFAFGLVFGVFDDALHVLHKCDNPPCVRQDHLFLGTPHDNLIDAYQKGRLIQAKGHKRREFCRQGHPLTDDMVRIETYGYRRCLTCDRENQMRRYYKRTGVQNVH